jgi:SAM-dependent methyltransferase
MHLRHRTSCRVCSSSALTKVIDLGEQYLQGSFVKPDRQLPPMRKMPTSLVRCDPVRDERACGLLQMEYTVPPEVLYSVYWYRSGTNTTMRNHLAGIARESAALLDKPTARVLDIGCNDGTLLAAFPEGFIKIGIDPSDLAREVPPGITVVRDLFPSEELFGALAGNTCDIVTSIAMFYDLEDPIAFAQAIRRLLSPDGLWCFEMSYMPTMLRMNSYDTICHEHLEYYSLAVIEYILQRADLKIVNVSLNASNGGSIRCYATHAGNLRYKRDEFALNVRTMRQQEFRSGPMSTATSSSTFSRSYVRGTRKFTFTAPPPRGTRSFSGAGSTIASSSARPNETPTNTGLGPWGRTSRSSARPTRARRVPITIWSFPGISARRSSNASARCWPPELASSSRFRRSRW